MDYANDYNLPFLQRPGAKKRLAVVVGGGIIVLIVVFTVINLIFSTADEEAALDNAAQSLITTRNIAQLASSYSEDNFINYNAASLNALATSHYRDLVVIKGQAYGATYEQPPLSLAEQDQALAEAARTSTEDELAADYMAQATQFSIEQLQAIEPELPAEYAEQLQSMRADLNLFLEDLAPEENQLEASTE